jgi:RimJ/RimL family protein N-acetyltransferase
MSQRPVTGGEQPDPLALAPGEWGRRTRLRDGTRVLLRQIRPADRDRLAEGLRRLSPASRLLRFHVDRDELTDGELDYLSQVDHLDHEAIVALDLDHPEMPGLGLARYIRDPYERHVAEAAVTVADDYQRRGVGTLLLGALAALARTHGVQVFRSYVLEQNQPMLRLLDQLGAFRELEAVGLWRVDLALPERDADLRDSPAGKAFLAAAKDGFRLAHLLHPVWCHIPSRATGGGSAATSIEDELAPLRDELDQWLAHREQRSAGWPAEDAQDAQDLEEPAEADAHRTGDGQP